MQSQQRVAKAAASGVYAQEIVPFVAKMKVTTKRQARRTSKR